MTSHHTSTPIHARMASMMALTEHQTENGSAHAPNTHTNTHIYIHTNTFIYQPYTQTISCAIVRADTGPPTFKVRQAGEVDRLDGVEALLEVSGSLFDDISGGQRDGPSVLQVGLALEEEHEQPHW